jgi:hypothetical protein
VWLHMDQKIWNSSIEWKDLNSIECLFRWETWWVIITVDMISSIKNISLN